MKKIVSMIMIVTLMFCTCTVASAATNSTLHKVNGIYSTGGGKTDEYTSTITVTCNKITAMGTTYDGYSTKYVDITVYKSGQTYAYKQSVPLNGQEQTLVSGKNLPTGTYTIKVKSYDAKPYDVSTYFYY